MPYLQAILIVIGSTATGTCFGFLLAFCLCLLLPSKPGEWGEAYLAIFLLMIGSIAGTVAGFIQGTRWVTQRGTKPWKPITWAGIVVGMLLGWCFQFVYPGLLHDITRNWWFAIIPIIAFGMLGGLVSTYATSIEKIIPRPLQRKRAKKRKARPKITQDGTESRSA